MPASLHCCMYVLLNLQFDKCYGKVKEDLRGKVELYPSRQDNETWAHYQSAMAEELDKEMIELSQPLEQQMRAFVIRKLGHFQGQCKGYIVFNSVCMGVSDYSHARARGRIFY